MNSFQADGSYVSSLAGLESNGSQKAQNQLLQMWDWDPAAGQTHHQASLFGGAAATAYSYNLPPMGIDGGGYPFLSVAAEDYSAALIKNEEDRAAGQIGLNLGRRTYFPSGEAAAIEQLFRRSRGIYQSSQQAARCQAEGCKADLSIAKHYHRRHKVCELHSKATVVVAGGTQQRFCQQCSRFHMLSEFDEAKRSCRKRLAEHNRRRRKSQSSPTISAPTNYPGNSMDRLRHPSNDPSRNAGAEQVNPLPGTSASTISGMSQSNTNMDENKAMAQLWNGPSLSLGGSSADGATPGKGHNYGFPSPYQSQMPSWVFLSDENNNGNSASQRSSSSSSSMFHHSQALFCNAAAEGSHAAATVTEANLLQLGQGLLEVDFL